MLKIDDLIVTQHRLRNYDQIPEMVQLIKDGGIWTVDVLNEYAAKHHPGRVSPVIQISEFPDSQRFIHDGHHRVVTAHLGGRDFLYPEEYHINKWTYPEYLEINLEAGWFTPFDPRNQCRLCDLTLHKAAVRSVWDFLGVDEAKKLIRRNQRSLIYWEPRLFSSVKEMAIFEGLVESSGVV